MSVTGYNIYQGTSPGRENQVGTSNGPDAISYMATGLTSGTTYYFEVTALSESLHRQSLLVAHRGSAVHRSVCDHDITARATRATHRTDRHRCEQLPDKPELDCAAATAGASVTGYKIYAGTSPGGESRPGSTSASSDAVTGLSSRTTYYFEVTAIYQGCIDRPCHDTESRGPTRRTRPRTALLSTGSNRRSSTLGRSPPTWSG